MSGGGSGGQGKQKTSAWEWVVAALSAVLVLGSMGFLLWEALTERASPPAITVQVDSIVNTGSGYVVEFRAHNRGQTTGAGVVIEGELLADTGSVETSSVTLDYVPSESSRGGGLFFSHDPARYRLRIRPKGYDRP